MAYISPALLAKYNATGPRDSRFPAMANWRGGIDHSHYRNALASRESRDLALYTHFPFCIARCAYCACTAMPCGRPEAVDEYIARLDAELRLIAEASGKAPVLGELHWGGGTPNFLRDGQLVRAFDVIATHCELASGIECTIEADPRLVTMTQLRWLRGLGFQRISFGVQDLTPRVQHTIGRVQSTALVADVVDIARQQGFRSLNLDLVYGLPSQTTESFGDTVDATIDLAPDRVSCFAYAHMPWSNPNQQRMDVTELPSYSERFALHRLAVTRFTDAGYVWLGLDHFVRPDDVLAQAAAEGTLTHDALGFSAGGARDVIGIGVSACSEVGDLCVQNASHLGDWQRAVDAGQLPIARGHRRSAADRTRDTACRALLCSGVLERAMLPADDEACFDRFVEFEREGLVRINEHRITVTPTGRFFVRNLAMAMAPTDANYTDHADHVAPRPFSFSRFA